MLLCRAHVVWLQADVINRGFGGYNTDAAMLSLAEILDSVCKQQILIALVWLGANDAAVPGARECVWQCKHCKLCLVAGPAIVLLDQAGPQLQNSMHSITTSTSRAALPSLL